MPRSASLDTVITVNGSDDSDAALTSNDEAHSAIGDPNLHDILDLDSFLRRYPDLASEARMRWWIYRRKPNGLESSRAIIKRAGRWYVVVPRLRAWLLSGASESV